MRNITNFGKNKVDGQVHYWFSTGWSSDHMNKGRFLSIKYKWSKHLISWNEKKSNHQIIISLAPVVLE